MPQSGATPADPVAADPVALPPELRALHGLVMRRVMGNLSALTGRHDLTPAQLSALFRVRQQPGMPVSDIAAQLGLASGTTSHLVERLALRGLLARLETPGDRRQRRVSLTPAGVAFLEEVDAQLSTSLGTLFARVPAPEVADLAQAIRRVLPWLEGGPGETS